MEHNFQRMYYVDLLESFNQTTKRRYKSDIKKTYISTNQNNDYSLVKDTRRLREIEDINTVANSAVFFNNDCSHHTSS